MDAKLKYPKGMINETSFYGLGWGLAYGKNDSKTETYVSIWQWLQSGKYGWNNLSMRGDFTLEEVKADPAAVQMRAKPETAPMWQSLGNNVNLMGNELSVKAFRLFDTGVPERNLKLGETRRWGISFFDMAGPNAFSDIMDLQLSDNVEDANRKK